MFKLKRRRRSMFGFNLEEELRDVEVTVDEKTGFDAMKATRTRFFTFSMGFAVNLIVVASLIALSCAFFFGLGLGLAIKLGG